MNIIVNVTADVMTLRTALDVHSNHKHTRSQINKHVRPRANVRWPRYVLPPGDSS